MDGKLATTGRRLIFSLKFGKRGIVVRSYSTARSRSALRLTMLGRDFWNARWSLDVASRCTVLCIADLIPV